MSNSTRSSSSNNYDERFVVPLEASRRGAHRARVSPVMAILPIVAVVAVVILAITLVYLFFGGTGGSDTAAEVTASSAPPSASSTPTGAPSASAGSSGSASASSSAGGSVDKTIVVSVYNGTDPSVSGLARKAAARVTDAGWHVGTVATWTGAPVTETTIYYASADQQATAQAVAKALQHGVVRLSSAKAGSGIAAVIGNDYVAAAGSRSGSHTSASSASSSASSSSTSAGRSAARTSTSSAG